MDRSPNRRTPYGSSGFQRLLLLAGLGLAAASIPAFALEPCGAAMYPFPYTDV
jgi:hypothetical protein